MDIKELRERQAWTLERKIDHSLGVIEQFVSRLGKDMDYLFLMKDLPNYLKIVIMINTIRKK